MGLPRHLAERHVVADPRELLAGQRAVVDQVTGAGALLPAAVRTGERVEIALHAVVAIDLGDAVAERAPEIVDVRARRAGDPDIELEHRRVLGDHHRDRARALGRLACGAEAIARDVGADHERGAARGGAGRDPLDRGPQPGGAAVARVLGVVDPHRARQLEQAVHERRDRLGVIDAGLGPDDEHAERAPVEPRRGERPAPGLGRERHGVLARIGHGHLERAEALGVLGGRDAARPSELGELDVAARDRDAHRFDSYVLHGFLLRSGPGTARDDRRLRGSRDGDGPRRPPTAAAPR